MRIKQYFISLGLLIPAICIAGPIYENARLQAIALYNKGDYRKAIEQFIAAQEIAPVVNDLSSWILKCNKQTAIQNNKIKTNRVSSKKAASKKLPIQAQVVDDGFVVYDSIGRYNNDGIALAMLNGKYGYVNRAKKVVVPVIYDNTDIFGKPSVISVGNLYRDTISYKSDWRGIAMSVQRNGKWGFVNGHGKEIIPCKYDIVENYISKGDSLLPVGIDDKFGFIDLSGNVVIPLNYEFAGKFSRGVAPIVKEGKLGFINTRGEIVIDCIYDPKYEITDGKASIKDSFWLNDIIAIRKKGKWGLINLQGKEVYPFKYDDFVTWSSQGTGHGNILVFTFKNKGTEVFVFNGKEYLSEAALEEAKLKFKAEMGVPEFIYDLAVYYWNKGEYNPSSFWAAKGDELDHAGCSRLLGAYWLFYTDRPSMASYYLNKAADKDDDIAQYLLGLMYEEDLISGNGKKKDKHRNIVNRSEAIDWYKKSARNGNQQAKERLKSLGIDYNERTN